MTVRTITIVAVTVLALGAAIGTAYRLDAREPRKPYPKPTPPPPASQVFEPSTEPVLSEEQIEAQAREHNGQLEQAIERALVARDTFQRETAFTFLLPELLQVEPQRVVALWQRQEPGEARDLLRDEIARQWARRDREATVQWIKSIEDPAQRTPAAQVAVDSLAAIAPGEAIYVADQLGIGRDDGYLERLVQLWAESNLADAERWLASQPDDARTAPLRARIERVRDQRKTASRG